MYAKFQFYSSAHLFASSLEAPVAILLGKDRYYWVVEEQYEATFLRHGCSGLYPR